MHDDWRFLQSDQCVRKQGFTTDYNGDQRVPPYQGIMFEVVATSSIQVTTLEFDVRLDRVANDDLVVEAYVAESGYLGIMDDPTQWSRVARGKLEVLGGTTAAISEADFQSFSIAKGQRRSIYVSLLTGSYLDHTVNALDKTGELAAENTDMKVYVGTGFHGPSFKSLADTVLDPQFAGTIRYETTVPCSSLAHETTVSLAFVVELSESSDAFARLPFLLAEAMGKVLDDLLRSDNVLSELVGGFQLKRTNQVATRESDFIESWLVCPAVYHELDLQLEHAEALDSGKVLRLVYDAVSDFETQATEIVNQLVKGRHAYYVGQALTDVPFTMKLEGPNIGVPMTVVQADYFSDQMIAFIVATKGLTPIQILDVSVEGQLTQETRAIRRLSSDSTEIIGRVIGTAPVGFSVDYFGAVVANSFSTYPGNFLELLRTEGAKPSVLDAKSYALFRELESATAAVAVPDVPYLPSKAESTKSLAYIIIMGVVGGLTVLIGSFKFSKYRIKKARDDNERRMYREKMRQERQEKRIERSQSREELVSVDGTTDLSLWEEINPQSESGSSSASKTSLEVEPQPETSEHPCIDGKDSSKSKPNETPSLASFLGESTTRPVPASTQSLSDGLHGTKKTAGRAPPIRTYSDAGVLTKGQTGTNMISVDPSKDKIERGVARSKSSDVLRGVLPKQALPGHPRTLQIEPSSENIKRGVGRSKSTDGLSDVLPKLPVRRTGTTDDRSVASLPAPQRPLPGHARRAGFPAERLRRGVGRSKSTDGFGDVLPKLPVRRVTDDGSVPTGSLPLQPPPGMKRGVGRSRSTDGFCDGLPKLPVRRATDDRSVASTPKQPPPGYPQRLHVEPLGERIRRGVGRSKSTDGLGDVLPKLPVRRAADDRSIASLPKQPPRVHPPKLQVGPSSEGIKRGVGRSRSTDGLGGALPKLPVRRATDDKSAVCLPKQPPTFSPPKLPTEPSSGGIKRGVGRIKSTDGLGDALPKLPVRRSTDEQSVASPPKQPPPGHPQRLQVEPFGERIRRGVGRSKSTDGLGDALPKLPVRRSTDDRSLASPPKQQPPGNPEKLQVELLGERIRRGVGRGKSTDGFMDVLPKLLPREAVDNLSNQDHSSDKSVGDLPTRRPPSRHKSSSTAVQHATTAKGAIPRLPVQQQSLGNPPSKTLPRRHHSSTALLLAAQSNIGSNDHGSSSIASGKTRAFGPLFGNASVCHESSGSLSKESSTGVSTAVRSCKPNHDPGDMAEKLTVKSTVTAPSQRVDASTAQRKHGREVCPGALHSPGSSTGTTSLQDNGAGNISSNSPNSLEYQDPRSSKAVDASSQKALLGGDSPLSAESNENKSKVLGTKGSSGEISLAGISTHSKTQSRDTTKPRSTEAPTRRRGLTRATSSSALCAASPWIDDGTLQGSKLSPSDTKKRNNQNPTQNRREGLSRTLSSSVLRIEKTELPQIQAIKDQGTKSMAGSRGGEMQPAVANSQLASNRRGGLSRSTSSRLSGAGGSSTGDNRPAPAPKRCARRGGLTRSMSSRLI